MTVIAWDGKTLAADKRAVNCGLSRTVTKISRNRNGELLGVTGDFAAGLALRAWYEAGANAKEFPDLKGDTATLVVVSRTGVRLYESGGPWPVCIEDAFFAAGSGRDFALAAMELGRNASQAVALACKFQSDCGNGVDALDLQPGSLTLQSV